MLAATLWLFACSRQTVRPTAMEIDGQQLLMQLEATNRGLDAVKGVGSFTLRARGVSHNARVAWIAAAPSRIRLHVFGLLGQGQLTLAADGRRIYYHSPADGRFYSRGADDPDLEKVVGFPINVSDLAAFLMGRVPLRSYSSTRVLPDEEKNGWIVLSLDRFWGSSLEKIFFDGRGRVWRVEFFSFTGKLLYRAEISKRHMVNGFALPWQLLLTGRDERHLGLEVDRCWVNPELSPDIFTLTAAGSS